MVREGWLDDLKEVKVKCSYLIFASTPGPTNQVSTTSNVFVQSVISETALIAHDIIVEKRMFYAVLLLLICYSASSH